MKVLITAPDLDDTRQVGGIITLVNTIISVINVRYTILFGARQPESKIYLVK